ncbi:PhoH family protein [Nitratidesulfovibrio vulgaris]|uniref:PhoH family protein n=1 Tax=Nitratidesulfovibrio vulgaris TaxID=881 RepID=UPI0023005F48|nr:PhoH family protein [Nitratidesulfovibrio vulgaris]WCB45436.1 PhoH family protein [Nitratidesulfovibrio vulgaris]
MTQTQTVETLSFDDAGLANQLFGAQNGNLDIIAERSGTSIDTCGNAVTVSGENATAVETVLRLLTQLYGLLKAGHPLYARDVTHAYSMLEREPATELHKVFREAVFVVSPRKTVTAKTLSQRDYVDALRDNDMVFAVGPAGTGKTYLAVATALALLQARRVKRIILTRPAVEAGEKLGFLPGDLVEKVNPYLRPLYDALHDMLDFQKVTDMLETGVIEIAPLAFMRGRTLNDAFIILDEAQNTTPEQMKMFLTRMGFGSRAVITGDVTQIDLPTSGRGDALSRSGLVQAMRILDGVKGIRIIRFHEADVIRHPLVGRIVQAYERHESVKNNHT